MSQTTLNTQAFIDAEIYSTFILENMHEGLLPETMYRNVTDFPHGTELNIKTIGTTTLQETEEDTPVAFSPIDTGTVTLHITEFPADGWYVTDKLREDGSQIEQLMAMRSEESTRALQEYFETKFLSTAAGSHTDNSPNLINGFAHRIASAESGNVLSLDHLIAMKLAFDKAKVPAANRVLLCDPVVEATLNKMITPITSDYGAFAEEILVNGFSKEHRFIRNLFGWNIVTTNMLPKGSFADGTTTVTDGVANIFMSVADDNTKPIMGAWRRMPKVEGYRNVTYRRDEFSVTARFGFGAQRLDTLGTLITSASNY